jgi:predicted nucleic acid-binding protein
MRDAPVIADTGVIAALINQKDQWHEWAFEQASLLAPPFFTCESVITEVYFLLQNVSRGEQKVLGMLADGYLQISFSLAEETGRVRALMKKYENVPMSFADACLVRMNEIIDGSVIFTTDSDFLIYRKNLKHDIRVILPVLKKSRKR